MLKHKRLYRVRVKSLLDVQIKMPAVPKQCAAVKCQLEKKNDDNKNVIYTGTANGQLK